jgi:hypothetical protein
MRKILKPSILAASVAAVLLTGANRIYADDFFNVTATGSGGTNLSVNGSNVINLADNFINEQKQFSSLAGQNISAAVTYGGVPNALLFTENSGGTSATLTIPSTGFTKTFTGTDSANLQQQIKDFLKTDASQAYAQFLEQMDRLSPVATLDGNPQASTALIADSAFSRYGLENRQLTEYKRLGDAAYFDVAVDGGTSRASGLDGTWAQLDLESGLRFTDFLALSLATDLDYRNVAGAAAYTVDEQLGLPITFINNKGDGFSWQVTPWAFAGLSASYDEAAGSVLVGGGGTSSFAFHLGTLTLTLADQISYNGDVPVNVDGYGFDTVINQWIVKNGIDANYRFAGTPFFIDGSVAYTDFIRKAAVPDYITPGIGFGLAFGSASSLRFGYTGDFAKRYNANGGEVVLVISY